MDINTRVQIPVHTDEWMQGDRFGSVTRSVNHPAGHVTYVLLDKSQRTIIYRTDSLRPVDTFKPEWIG